VLDAYGCGDTFAGCLAAWLGRGADMPAAIAAASAEAARCATWRGGLGPVR
jgi:sugar/nucleoside kinase (ribokinase family)